MGLSLFVVKGKRNKFNVSLISQGNKYSRWGQVVSSPGF